MSPCAIRSRSAAAVLAAALACLALAAAGAAPARSAPPQALVGRGARGPYVQPALAGAPAPGGWRPQAPPWRLAEPAELLSSRRGASGDYRPAR